MTRLRVVLEFSKKKENDIKLFNFLNKYSNPGAIVKDILFRVIDLPNIENVSSEIPTTRLRIVIEFSKNKERELLLFQELIRYSKPGAIVKDMLLGLVQLPDNV